jgi:predicted N-acyltransferase
MRFSVAAGAARQDVHTGFGVRAPPPRGPTLHSVRGWRRPGPVTAVHAPAAVARDELIVLGGADRLPADEWNQLARRGFHLHQWFTEAERSGWNPRHLAVQGAAGLKTIIPAYLVGPGTPHDLHHRWLGRLSYVAASAGFRLQPVLSVQAPFAHVSQPLGNFSGVSSAILHEIFYALEQTAEREGAKAVAWPFVDTACDRLLDVAAERGYAVLYAGATAVLRVRWPTFEEYLTSRSPNVRRIITADIASIGAAGLRTTLTSEFECDASHMDRLYRDAFRQRNGRESPVAPHLFQQLGRRQTPGIWAHLTWHGDRLVGSSLNLTTPEQLDGSFAAFAPEHRASGVFYNDLCYEPLRVAIGESVSSIDLGPTRLYAKVLRGAVLQRRMILIRGTTPPRHRLLSTLGRLVARRTQRQERKSLGSLWGPRCFVEEAADMGQSE